MRVYEVIDSMSGSISREQGQAIVKEVRRRYVIGQCGSFDDCEAAILPYAPMYAASAGGYWLRQNLNITGVGNGYFDCTATYRTLVPSQQQENNNGQPPTFVPGGVAWDTTGGTEHMTQAIQQTGYGSDTPDFEGAINVSGNAVQGVDVVRPSLRYSETWIMPVSTAMNCGYIGAVFSLTGTVNQDNFRCFAPGEVLFLGARGQWQEDQPYVAITFEFEVRANDDDFYPFTGFSQEPVAKKGWEYFWILYEDAIDANALVRHPIAGYISQVYHEKPWDNLGIGDQAIGNGVSGQLPQNALPGGNGFGN